MSRRPIRGKELEIKRPTAPSLPRDDAFGSIGSVIGGMIPSLPGRLPDPKPPRGPIGGIIGGMPYPEIGRPVVPTKPRPDYKPNPEYAPGYGGRIGAPPGSMFTMDHIDRDGDGIDDRHQKGPGYNPFTGKTDDKLLDRIKRKEEERREREERKRFVEEKRKTDPMYFFEKAKKDRVKSKPRSRLNRKQIDKSPEARQKFLDSLTREELEQRSHQDPVRGSRVQPVQENSSRVQPVQENNSRVKPVQEGSSRVKPVQDRRTRDFNPNLESFDAKQYLANYGDLQKAFGSDEAKARQHFIDYGMKEGRVDTAGGGTLKAETRDRRAKTFKAKSRAAAAKRREGFLRGEEGATFDAKQYLANYADLQKAFGSDEEKARQHYRQYGAKEGRVDTRM